MRRMKLSTILAILALSMVLVHAASAAVIDFEGFDLGGKTFEVVDSSLAFNDVDGSGVDVTIEAGVQNRIYDLFLFANDPNATSQALIDYDFPTGSNPDGTMILFSTPIESFSLVAGDFGGAQEADGLLEITAFGANDQVVATDSVQWPAGMTAPFAELSISGVRVSKILYQSGGSFAGSTFIDDLTFTPVPEPSSALLLGIGLTAIAAGRRRGNRR